MATPRILIVDDDRAVRTALKINLSKSRYEVETAVNTIEAHKFLSEGVWDLVLTDVKMPGASGLTLLTQIRQSWPDTSVILMTGYGNVEDAVRAMREGASDYLIKPITKDDLLVRIERTFKERRLERDVVELREKVDERYHFGNLIGDDQKMRVVCDLARHVAETSATVLIEGPTGTGKELMANAIHFNSPRRNEPFIRVNCGALPETLLESELFGHEKGSFSGAIRQHRGRFELADRGTLLLDEIGEISLAMQVKLLRVLEVGEFQRVGGTDTLKVDVRVITATNKNLAEEVHAGRFRQDLYYRLNVFRLAIPSLKERRDDIPKLVDHFIHKYATKNKKKITSCSTEAMKQFMEYDWPGNVRELEHVIERAVILCKGKEIAQVDLPTARTPGAGGTSTQLTLAQALRKCEKDTIIAALRAHNKVQARAADALGISRSNLNYRLGKLKIQVNELGEGPSGT